MCVDKSPLSDVNLKDPDKIIEALDRQIVKKSNIIFQRFQFNQAAQQQHETIEQFVDLLRHLAKTCNFKTNRTGDKNIVVMT